MSNDVHILISLGIFSASILAALIHTLVNRKRTLRWLNHESSQILPSDLRIERSRAKLVLLAGGLSLFGLYSLLFVKINLPYAIATGLMFAIGILLLILVLLRKIPFGWLRFSQSGFEVGSRKGLHTIPWTEIEEYTLGEFFGNPCLFLLLGPSAIHPSWIDSKDPSYLDRVNRTYAKNVSLLGAHVFIVLEVWDAPAKDIFHTIRAWIEKTNA